jgi:Ca2+-binding EF-hand superfamily protein
MDPCMRKIVKHQARAGALMLGLALLTSGCASGSSSSASSGMTSQELYNEYDSNNDGQITQQEWDQAYRNMDANGDGVVSQDEFNAAVSRGGGGRH